MLVLSFSGLGEDSLTLASLEVLEHHPDVSSFDKVLVTPHLDFDKNPDKFEEILDKMKSAEIVIWAVSPFHMNIPSHMIAFFERCRAAGLKLNNVNTFFHTNMRVCDTFLSLMLERQIRSLGGYFVYGLSYATCDMTNSKMTLFTLATPDGPPKKSLFGKAKEWEMGEGLKNAVSWIKLLEMSAKVLLHGEKLSCKPKKVVFVDMEKEENTIFVSESVSALKELYKSSGCEVLDVHQKDYADIHRCDGCKICYAPKVCKYKDSYDDYEAKLEAADIIIYYGNVTCGYSSALSKSLLDREVHNGLMIKNGVTPDEMDKYQAVGYIVDVDNADSYGVYKEYNLSLMSFGFRHFLGVYADSKVPNMSEAELKIMYAQSMLFLDEGMLPQRNFWSEKVGRHFADLSRSIPFVIPREGEFYRKAGAYNPIVPDANAKTVEPDTVKIGRTMRKIPYQKTMEQLDKLSK